MHSKEAHPSDAIGHPLFVGLPMGAVMHGVSGKSSKHHLFGPRRDSGLKTGVGRALRSCVHQKLPAALHNKGPDALHSRYRAPATDKSWGSLIRLACASAVGYMPHSYLIRDRNGEWGVESAAEGYNSKVIAAGYVSIMGMGQLGGVLLESAGADGCGCDPADCLKRLTAEEHLRTNFDKAVTCISARLATIPYQPERGLERSLGDLYSELHRAGMLHGRRDADHCGLVAAPESIEGVVEIALTEALTNRGRTDIVRPSTSARSD